MGAKTKFLFETDFGNAETSKRIARRYTEDDLQKARTDGLHQARAELASLEEKRAADVVAGMAAKLDELTLHRAEDLQSAVETAVDIAVAICHKVLPTLAAKNALSEIEGHIARTLADVHGEPRVVVRMSEQNVATLRGRVEQLAAGFDGKLVLIADDQLSATDCHVMWADGGSERSVERTWTEINKVVERITANGICATAPQGDALSDPDAADMGKNFSFNNNAIDKISKPEI